MLKISQVRNNISGCGKRTFGVAMFLGKIKSCGAMFFNKIESCLELKSGLHVEVSHQFYLVDSNFH